MDSYGFLLLGFLWILRGSYGSLRIPMDSYGFLWILTTWIPNDSYGIPMDS
jgi:hypothetical protein